MSVHSSIYRFIKVVKVLDLANKRLTTAKIDCLFLGLIFLIKGTKHPSRVKSYNNVIAKNFLV